MWLVGFQLRVSAAHPGMTLQMTPASLEYWKSTDPVGASVLSEPGAVIDTDEVAVTGWPETELSGARATAVVVCAGFTTWVTGVREVDPSKLPSPE
jgi:hypothetical protein